MRRAAWARVARLLARSAGIPHDVPREYASLFRETLREIEAYATQRAAGELGSPPGGVGSRKA